MQIRINTSQLFATMEAPGLANARSMTIAATAKTITTRVAPARRILPAGANDGFDEVGEGQVDQVGDERDEVDCHGNASPIVACTGPCHDSRRVP